MSGFSQLLELDTRRRKYEDKESVEMAARLWEKAGSPSARRDPNKLLESFLNAGQREGRYYAPILLRRKKELQRGDFRPRPTTEEQARPLPPAKNTLCVERESDPAIRAKIEGWKQQLRERGFLSGRKKFHTMENCSRCV